MVCQDGRQLSLHVLKVKHEKPDVIEDVTHGHRRDDVKILAEDELLLCDLPTPPVVKVIDRCKEGKESVRRGNHAVINHKQKTNQNENENEKQGVVRKEKGGGGSCMGRENRRERCVLHVGNRNLVLVPGDPEDFGGDTPPKHKVKNEPAYCTSSNCLRHYA